MKKQMGIMIIHGMGDQKATFADEFISRLQTALGDGSRTVCIQPCWWADILQERQDAVYDRVCNAKGPRWRKSRKWVMGYLGDPTGYLLSASNHHENSAYGQIHERVRVTLKAIEDQLDDPTNTPLMILAHSLGCVVVSDYIWNDQNDRGVGESAFQRMRSLTSLITYGCNLPLFAPPVRDLVSIEYPSRDTPDQLNKIARWMNIYAPADILGYPLSKLWNTTQPGATPLKIDDIPLNPGCWPFSRTPLSHSYYESDAKFVRIVSKEILRVLDHVRSHTLTPAG
jgi:hypothetical protein